MNNFDLIVKLEFKKRNDRVSKRELLRKVKERKMKWGTWLSQSEGHMTLDLGVVEFEPCAGGKGYLN